LPIGEYGIYFSYTDINNKEIDSNSLIFTVVDEIQKKDKEKNIRIPNIKVNYVTTGNRIADIYEADDGTYIDIFASHPDL
jgi:hypothetical protein